MNLELPDGGLPVAFGKDVPVARQVEVLTVHRARLLKQLEAIDNKLVELRGGEANASETYSAGRARNQRRPL